MANLQEKLNKRISQVTEDYENNETPMKYEAEVIHDNKLDVVPDFAITLSDARDRLKMLRAFVQEFMVKGEDYGIIPGCNKPSLLKPGAEKLCEIFGFSKQIQVINRMEDWQVGIFSFEVKATLINKRTGLIEAEGIGSCNSKEKKYRNQDAFSIVNTLLKMAKKRALVDSVLSATRSSGIFTQDIEDMNISNGHDSNTPPSSTSHNKPSSKAQISKIHFLAKQLDLQASVAKQIMLERYKVEDSGSLNSRDASDFISYLIKLQEATRKNKATA